jgi:hypothetical protein
MKASDRQAPPFTAGQTLPLRFLPVLHSRHEIERTEVTGNLDFETDGELMITLNAVYLLPPRPLRIRFSNRPQGLQLRKSIG